MISLCTGLIAAIFSYIRTELRLNQNLETIRETACMEHLQELDREDTGEALYAAAGKAMGKMVRIYAAGRYMSETEED